MTAGDRHVHRCPTLGCGGSVIHTSGLCLNPGQVYLCVRCYYASQRETGKADSEWDPYNDSR